MWDRDVGEQGQVGVRVYLGGSTTEGAAAQGEEGDEASDPARVAPGDFASGRVRTIKGSGGGAAEKLLNRHEAIGVGPWGGPVMSVGWNREGWWSCMTMI